MTNSPRWISGVKPSPELLSADGTQILEIECREQPSRLLELILAYSTDSELQAQFNLLRQLSSRPGPIFFFGMGASYCSSISGTTLLQSSGKLAFPIDAGEWLHYARPLNDTAALSLLLTTSGESAELVELMKLIGEDRSVLICNNSASTCWKMALHRLPISAGPEYGNATKTYTNATAASIILASELLGRSWQRDAYSALDVFSAYLDPIFAMRSELESFSRGAQNIEIIGRGAAFGGAIMSALCIREMSGKRAAAHTGAGFRHGPNLDVDESHLAIIFALGRVAELGVKLAAECNRRGGKVILISNQQHSPNAKLLPVMVGEVPEPWEGITSLLVPQALTLAMVERSGCRLPPRFQYGIMEQ